MTPGDPLLRRLSAIYPTTRVCGNRITRWEEQALGFAVLDVTTASEMGREQIGWFVGKHPGFDRAIEQFGRLDVNPRGGVWIIVPRSYDLAIRLYEKWPYRRYVQERPRNHSSTWNSRKVWVACPQDLARFVCRAREQVPGIAGLIVFDPPCDIHRTSNGVLCYDSTQRVVNFRSDLGLHDRQPPLLMLTTRPAKTINTDVVARVFGLNAFWFIDGDSFNCCATPIA